MCVISLGINSPSPPGHPKISIQDYSVDHKNERRFDQVQLSRWFHRMIQHYPENSPPHEESPWGSSRFVSGSSSISYQYILCWMHRLESSNHLSHYSSLLVRTVISCFKNPTRLGNIVKMKPLRLLDNKEESFELPCCRSGVLGLNLSDLKSGDFLQQWKEKATDGLPFQVLNGVELGLAEGSISRPAC